MKTMRSIAGGTATLLSGVAVAAVFALGVLMWAGYRPEPVLTGSMEPVMPVGSLVVVRAQPATTVREGDVITFQRPDDPSMRITHRVVAIRERDGHRVYRTKGDANPTRDPWDLQLPGAVGKRVATVPYVGYAVIFAGSRQARLVLIPAAVLLALLVFLRWVWRPAPKPAAARS